MKPLAFIAPDKTLISPQKHMLWYSLEVPHGGATNEYLHHMLSWRNDKKKWKKLDIPSYLELCTFVIRMFSASVVIVALKIIKKNGSEWLKGSSGKINRWIV